MPFLEKKAHPERNVNKNRKKCLERSANGKGQENGRASPWYLEKFWLSFFQKLKR